MVYETRRYRSVSNSPQYATGGLLLQRDTDSDWQPVAYYLLDVVNSSERKPKVVVLKERERATIYTTKMSKQVTKGHVRDAVHMYLVN
jgi:hypothetical protein